MHHFDAVIIDTHSQNVAVSYIEAFLFLGGEKITNTYKCNLICYLFSLA